MQTSSRINTESAVSNELRPPTSQEPVPVYLAVEGVITPDGFVRVKIEDINVPFTAMVGLICKFAFASIPAFVILGSMFAIIAFIISEIDLSMFAR
jgi:hypothetical protein